MLQQMLEMTAARFHAVTQTFAPLILCCRQRGARALGAHRIK